MPPRSFRLTLLPLLTLAVCLPLSVNGVESAWNGQTPPGSATPAPFTPYYVPPGAQSYDSASPLVTCSGSWMTVYSRDYIGYSVRSTNQTDASCSLTFTGTGIEWFGETDNTHGNANVYLDGKFIQNVDTRSDQTLNQQRIFADYSLSYAKHTIKVVNKTPKPMNIDAFVVTKGQDPSTETSNPPPQPASDDSIGTSTRVPQPPGNGSWSLIQQGSTGVSAMQLAVISNTHALIIDKVEHNPVNVNGHPAWAALFDLRNYAITPLAVQSNSFCAGGTFLSNGTLINVGGNPVVEDYTSAANFGDLNGLQAIRIFQPCDGKDVDSCTIYEDHDRIRLASPRWYNTALRISDGSAMIIGGSLKGGWINNKTVNNPTIEYWPPKGIHGSNGMPIPFQFLNDTLNANLFPIAFALPDNTIFVAANNDATIYDWEKNTERRLPSFPNGIRVTYPMAGTGLLLPLSSANNYTPEVLICGGLNVSDTTPGYKLTSQLPASNQCVRMVLNDNGIAGGWQVEQMPTARHMPDAVLLPTGHIVLVNGAGTGISGYGNVEDQIGQSNADNPVLTPVLYDPSASAGSRFIEDGMPTSDIPRMYHSTATLTPSGEIMIAGSNPNLDRSAIKYGTEYRVEWLSPPYMQSERPALGGLPKKIWHGEQLKITVTLPETARVGASIQLACMDLGFVTHAVHANSRLVYLDITPSTVVRQPNSTITLQATGPPTSNIYPPGPAWLYVVVDGVPSEGKKVLIGSGDGPPVDEAASENVLNN